MFNWLVELFKIQTAPELKTKIGYAVLCILAVLLINRITTYKGGFVCRVLANIVAVLLLIFAAVWCTTGVYWYRSADINTQQRILTGDSTVGVPTPDFLLMQTAYTVQQGGTVLCDVYNLTDMQLTVDDVKLCDGLNAEVTVLTADDTVQRSVLTLTGVTAPVGVYTVKIGDTCTMTVTVISEEISTEIQLNCVPSATEISDGGTLTVSAIYTGIAVDNNTITYLMCPEYITFENMVGNVNITNATDAVYNISVSDVCILDKRQKASMIINSGSAIDGNGVACYAVTVDVTAAHEQKDKSDIVEEDVKE